MKKVYLILTLFVASLFFFSNKVYAATYTYELSEETVALINDDFLNFREKVIKFVEDNGYKDYLIAHNGVRFIFYVYSETSTVAANDVYGSSVLQIGYTNASWGYANSNNELNIVESNISSNFNILSPSTVLNYFIDSSFTLTNKGIEKNVFKINYKDTTYTIERYSIVPSLYQIYLEHNIPDEPVDRFLEDKEIMNNFYSTIFTKIGELATNLANNYIFLLIFGIFILIFIFEIIRRRII